MSQEQKNATEGLIFDVDHFSVHDGPGIRAVVYFKGCPLRCLWCHSPESQSMAPEALRLSDKCQRCEACAGAGCRFGAWSLCGRRVRASDLLEEILPDQVFFESSGGGVTLSGGEVLSQPEFATELLAQLKVRDIHTVIETCGLGRWEDLAALSPLVDCFYYDIKTLSAKKHRQYTGAGNALILENLGRLVNLRSGQGIVLRAPMIPGYNDDREEVASLFALAGWLGLDQVHLLPYNPSASAKYEWLGRTYTPGTLEPRGTEYLAALCALAPPGLHVTVQ